jgi:hypothetical protein
MVALVATIHVFAPFPEDIGFQFRATRHMA